MDETYTKVKGGSIWTPADEAGDTVDFLLRAHHANAAPRSVGEQAIERIGGPGKVTIDKSNSNVAVSKQSTPSARSRSSSADQVLEQILEQDRRAVKRQT